MEYVNEYNLKEHNVRILLARLFSEGHITREMLAELEISERDFLDFMQANKIYTLCDNVEYETYNRIREAVDKLIPDWEERKHVIQSSKNWASMPEKYKFELKMTKAEYTGIRNALNTID